MPVFSAEKVGNSKLPCALLQGVTFVVLACMFGEKIGDLNNSVRICTLLEWIPCCLSSLLTASETFNWLCSLLSSFRFVAIYFLSFCCQAWPIWSIFSFCILWSCFCLLYIWYFSFDLLRINDGWRCRYFSWKLPASCLDVCIFYSYSFEFATTAEGAWKLALKMSWALNSFGLTFDLSERSDLMWCIYLTFLLTFTPVNGVLALFCSSVALISSWNIFIQM